MKEFKYFKNHYTSSIIGGEKIHEVVNDDKSIEYVIKFDGRHHLVSNKDEVTKEEHEKQSTIMKLEESITKLREEIEQLINSKV